MTTSVTIQNPKSEIQNPPDSTIARQLSAQYQLAIGGLIEQIKFGGMLMMLERSLSDRGRGNVANFNKAGEGLSNWLAEHCPEISRPTAHRFKICAFVVKQELQLGEKTDMAHLLGSALDALNPKEQRVRKHIEEFVTGKSQRQLLLDFRAGVADPKPKGGARPGTHPEPKSQEQQDAEALHAARESLRIHESELRHFMKESQWALLHKVELEGFVGLLESFKTAILTHLRSRKSF